MSPLGTTVSNCWIQLCSTFRHSSRSWQLLTRTMSTSKQSTWWYILKCAYRDIGVLWNFCLCLANRCRMVWLVSPTYCLPHRRQVRAYTTPGVRQCRPVATGWVVWFRVDARNKGRLRSGQTKQCRLPQEWSVGRSIAGGRFLLRSCFRLGLLNFCGTKGAAVSGWSVGCVGWLSKVFLL